MKTSKEQRDQIRNAGTHARDRRYVQTISSVLLQEVLDDLHEALADLAKERERAEKAEHLASEREAERNMWRTRSGEWQKLYNPETEAALRTALAESQRTLEAMQRESQRVVETNRAAATMKGAALTAIERIVTGNAQLLAHGHTQAELDELVQGVSTLRTALAESRAELETEREARKRLASDCGAYSDRLQAAEARAERLREVLQHLTIIAKAYAGDTGLSDQHSLWDCLDEADAALAETAQKKTSAATGEGARPVDHAPVKPSRPADGGPIEPGTSSPDEVERAAREFFDARWKDQLVYTPCVLALAALLRTRDAQAHEAGRVEAIEQVRFELCGVGGLLDALKRPDRAKGGG